MALTSVEYWWFFYPCLERNQQKLYSSTDLASVEGWLWTEMTWNLISSPSYKGRGAGRCLGICFKVRLRTFC